MEDSNIIALFWKRDEHAIAETQMAYGRKLKQLALRILKNQADAEECENDTYLKAWNTIPPQSPQYFYAYLAKICRFAAFGKLDAQNAQKRKAVMVELTAEMELCIPSTAYEKSLEQEEIGRQLNAFLAELSEENRLMFLRRYWFADSIREIAQRCGSSESKVKTALFRTRNKLKSYFEREGFSL